MYGTVHRGHPEYDLFFYKFGLNILIWEILPGFRIRFRGSASGMMDPDPGPVLDPDPGPT